MSARRGGRLRGRGVTAAWNKRIVLVDTLGFVLVEVLWVGGVTVDRNEEHFKLVNGKPT